MFRNAEAPTNFFVATPVVPLLCSFTLLNGDGSGQVESNLKFQALVGVSELTASKKKLNPSTMKVRSTVIKTTGEK